MTENNVRSAIEALLFAYDRPLTLEQFKKALDGLDTTQIRQALQELMSELESAKRGIRVVEVAGGFQMVTASDFAPFIKKLYKEKRIDRLSKPALETLAIIAYKQPVSRLEIESLRNVNADGVIDTLLEKNLIKIAGRKNAPGRPFVYGTTRQFLEYFGLKSLEELPRIESLALNASVTQKERDNESKSDAQTY